MDDSGGRRAQRRKAGRTGCSVEATLSVIGGVWKPVLLFHLLDGKLRDLSAVVADIGPAQLSEAALAKLRKLNPAKLPPVQKIAKFEEPILTCHIHVPNDYLGAVLKLCQDRRGVQKDLKYLGSSGTRIQVTYEMPLAEVVFDFFDKLKSVTRGYASLDYELAGYAESDLVRLDILINGDPVDALSVIVHKERAYQRGREVCQKLKEVIPKQMYEVAIQGAIGAKIISRETISAIRKNVLAKCYGGDISRKRKLLEKQKEGKKRMKQVGSVEIPQEAFLAVLQVD